VSSTNQGIKILMMSQMLFFKVLLQMILMVVAEKVTLLKQEE
jgi:hypothetical protein